ncbi:MAG: OmpA family protein [Endomicrobium sp.]|jgi:outer membrane protein OmpA-like peptidoglycan-associated protein|nr:OmpA family protein [Endomicrobium sp.]
MKKIYKIFPLLLLFVFLPACYSKHLDYTGGKNNKDMLSSKEILITSLFAATNHIPEEIKTDIEFFEHGKASLSKEARNTIAVFAADVLTYEDYSIIVEGHEDESEAGSGENYNKLSTQRAENVRRALIRNGIDKDKIEIIGIGISKPVSKEKNEESKKQNRRAVIEAELW